MVSTHIRTLLLAVFLLVVLLDLLLHLLVLDVVAALDVQDSMDVDSRLELADHEVVWPAGGLDALDGETADPRRCLAGEFFGFAVSRLQIEWLKNSPARHRRGSAVSPSRAMSCRGVLRVCSIAPPDRMAVCGRRSGSWS